ncbi:pyridoxal phosphate-dependent transferase [Mrakia frigida]|uniref:pyridoxal phosphate-dependent transferase n=1 Tax=Mrakia frigida TaxID=29902 RepID=UPI003FCBFCA1
MPPLFKISSAVKATAPPPIPLAFGWSQAYDPSKNGGRSLINLSQGVPGSAPHPSFVESLRETVKDPKSAKYGEILGERALRQALVEEYRDVYAREIQGWGAEPSGSGLTSDDVGIVCGANMAFMGAIMTLTQVGDEIILPTPFYFNNDMLMTLLSLKTVPLQTHAPSFLPSVEDTRKLITPRTRAIVLVTPNNPTGATYPPDLISEFLELALEHKVALIVDETYRDFLPPVTEDDEETRRGKPHNLFDTPKWREGVISLFSFSKSYSIPGHRLGVIVADPVFLNSMSTVLDCMQINPPRPSQLAITPLLPSLRPGLITTSQTFTNLLSIFSSVLSSCPGWTLLSCGAFYAFVSHPFGSSSKTPYPSLLVAQVLAEKYGVVTLPGEFFLPADSTGEAAGGGGWLRVAVANVGEEEVRGVGERLRALTAEDLEEASERK